MSNKQGSVHVVFENLNFNLYLLLMSACIILHQIFLVIITDYSHQLTNAV